MRSCSHFCNARTLSRAVHVRGSVDDFLLHVTFPIHMKSVHARHVIVASRMTASQHLAIQNIPYVMHDEVDRHWTHVKRHQQRKHESLKEHGRQYV